MFIRNAWYVAAWEREVETRPVAITILGERVVLYRQAAGHVAALEDACVHRKLPLSMGRVIGNDIECGYHGLRYDAAGACTRIPCSKYIPASARVRSYPVQSRYGLLWIWMGVPARAAATPIVEIAHWNEAGWTATRGDAMSVDCHYLLMTDNLLDPSHVAWVHPTTFGDAACEATPVVVFSTADGICASRWMRAAQVAPLYRRFVRFEGLCDRLQQYEVRFPCHAIVRAVFVPAGTRATDAQSHDAAFVMDSYNFLTPVDASRTRYFWLQMHNAPDSDADATAALERGVKTAFEEDRVILGAVQRGLDAATSTTLDIASDSAALRFRRRIRRLIDAECGPGSHG